MGLYKREDSQEWWIDISITGFKRIRQSAGTEERKKAQEYHDRLKAELWEQAKLGKKPRYRWIDAVVRYIEEAELKGKAAIDIDRSNLRWLDPHLKDLYLDEITKDVISNFIKEKKKPSVIVYGTGQHRISKPGVDTVNRLLNTFRSVLNTARDEWEWIEKVPKIKALPGAIERIRWITRDEANKLILNLPEHLAAMCEFSLQTGLRRSNVTHLRWSQIDMEKHVVWIEAEEVKNRKHLAIPLSGKAVSILHEWMGKNEEWVFPFNGSPVYQTSTKAWRDGLKKAGIKDFRWHDLRHTWASWHIQSGTPVNVLKDLGGWSSLKMVMRYAHMDTEHLKEWVDRSQLHLHSVEVKTENTGENYETKIA